MKTAVKNDILWSEIGSGFGELGSKPPSKIPRSTPWANPRAFDFLEKFLVKFSMLAV